MARKNTKATPQIEATVSLSITAKLMKFTARQDFTVGNCQIRKGETCFAVRSERREGRYYIVRYNNIRNAYQCSCGCNMCEHEHLKVVREYVMSHVVAPVKAAKAESSNHVEKPAPEMTKPLTSAEWRALKKRNQEWQKAEKAKDWAKVEEAREQSKREAALAAG